jgi:predicted nucleic acid-binding protein
LVLLDTSVLIEALTASRPLAPALTALLARGERVALPSLVIYEWLRGPRTRIQIEDQARLFPAETTILFGLEEAKVSAEIYRSLRRARTREMDIAIAACAIRHEAQLWTLNPADFKDIPGLRLLSNQRAQ